MSKDDNMWSDIDWIFEHGDYVLEKKHPKSAEALAACYGVKTLWDGAEDHFVYLNRVSSVIGMAQRFLKSGDKEGWLEFCRWRQERLDEYLKYLYKQRLLIR